MPAPLVFRVQMTSNLKQSARFLEVLKLCREKKKNRQNVSWFAWFAFPVAKFHIISSCCFKRILNIGPDTIPKLRIGSCLACVYRVMDARGKFGEHERSVRVARGDSREQL